jgi:hypothetical protein
LATVGGAVVYNPENSLGASIRLLSHHLADQTLKRKYSAARLATAKDFGASDIPGGQISYGTPAVVFEFYAHTLSRFRCLGRMDTNPSLDTGFLIRRDHVVISAQRLVLPAALVEVQDPSRLLLELRIARNIQLRCSQGRMASPSSQRQMVEPLI